MNDASGVGTGQRIGAIGENCQNMIDIILLLFAAECKKKSPTE